MRKLVLFASLFLNIFCLSAQTFTEMLSRPTDHTITVSIVFNTPVETYLEYGSKTGVYGSSTVMDTSVLNETVEILLSGLQPETRYYYRTRYRKIGDLVFLAGTEHTFMTQRKKGSPFVFTIESDPHPYDPKGYHPLWDISLQNQLKDGADFMLDLGDTFGDDHKVTTITSAQVQQLMLDNLPHFGGVCHSMPLYFCLGNHEGENGYFLLQTPPNNMAVYETRWRKMYYPNPFPDGFYTGNSTVENFGMDKPENYFAWEWGDALFVVIDGWRYYTTSAKPRNWDWTIGETQYKWLKQTLENSTAKFKIVFTHHVMGETRGGIGVANQCEWGGYDGNGKYLFTQYRPGWEMPIHQLMVKNNVSVLFQGHDHVYAREELDNIVYQTVPMPSDSSYSLGYIANGAAFTGTVLKGSGHIRVSVNADSLNVDFVSAVLPKDETDMLKNDQVVYSYSVKKSNTTALTSKINGDSPISIFPNPADDRFSIQMGNHEKRLASIRILSLEGKSLNLLKPDQQLGSNTYIVSTIDFNGNRLSNGIYCILLTFDDQSKAYKKLVVKG